MLYSLGDKTPSFTNKNCCFIADTATIVGEVTLMDNVNIWFNAVIRGDDNSITINANTNIQDGTVLHVDPGFPLHIGQNVTVGHKAILHGCTIGDNCLIGMNAVILNGAIIGNNCIIGACALVTQNMHIPDNSVVIGSPGKIMRQVTPKDQENIAASAAHYVTTAKHYLTALKNL